MDDACRIPLPLCPERPRAVGASHACGPLVAAFLDATAPLPCSAAAALAGVRPETIRNWRRRLPRWLRASTAGRLRAHLTGEVLQPQEAGFRKVFRQVMRATAAPGA